ncbi:uncharacterized protein LOC103046674 isoform X2 [Astyanax mexicanus]|uniref:uncharacterized protein LOC103046674 isoform X2 n=1 Tax=Astyanax mexicanus TaxID=7994 RepID=UPI0020CB5B59|nr:uncharacterized protein LOC103046674 isoform X2 [Astyanax mexicanus]
MKSTEGEEGNSGGNEAAGEHKDTSPEEKELCTQRSGMEEQLPEQEQKTAATSEPSAAGCIPDLSGVDAEQFFKILANSQSRRMDDQRVPLSMLPGTQIFSSKGSALMNQWESDQLCKFILRAQRFRMEDQRCTLPQIILTPETPVNQRKSYSRPHSPTHDPDFTKPPPRSASFSPTSENEKTEHNNNVQPPTLSPEEQDRLLTLVCQALRGRMEDQRCYLDPSMRRTQPPQGIENMIPNGIDPEQFFKLVAKIQSNRLDDQRVALNFLPGIQTPSGEVQKPLTVEETERLYNLISKVQSHRMEEQRCYAPNIQLGTPAPSRKNWDGNSSPMQNLPGPGTSSKTSRRSSAPVCPPSVTNQHQNHSSHTAHTAKIPVSADQGQYLSMAHKMQKWIYNHGHSTDPTALNTEQFFTLVANSQSKRMDDQRTTMPEVRTEKPFVPQIILTPESPAPRRASSRPTSLTQDPDLLTKPPPRSATFSPVSEKERTQYDNVSTKLTFKVSVCLTAPKQSNSDGQQSSSPDVFLTIGTPAGKNFLLPLTPMVCGPPSLETTPRPRRHRSRSSSPYRAHGRTSHPRPSSPRPAPHPPPIGTDEDYFSLIHRVHTAQLQQGNAAEKSREPGKGRERGDGRRERKDRVKRK